MQPERHRVNILAWLAVAAFLVPGPAWSLAEEPAGLVSSPPQQPPERDAVDLNGPETRVRVLDIRLGSDGTVVGRVRDERGRRMPGATVVLSTAGQVVARARTDDRGEYRVTGLAGGVYHVRVVTSEVIARLWTSESAPPRAREQLDLDATSRPTVEARGQGGEVVEDEGLDPVHRFGLDGEGGLDSFELTMLTTSIVSLTLSAVMLSKIAALQDTVDLLPASN